MTWRLLTKVCIKTSRSLLDSTPPKITFSYWDQVPRIEIISITFRTLKEGIWWQRPREKESAKNKSETKHSREWIYKKVSMSPWAIEPCFTDWRKTMSTMLARYTWWLTSCEESSSQSPSSLWQKKLHQSCVEYSCSWQPVYSCWPSYW